MERLHPSQQTVVIPVDSFERGPDADPDGPTRIVVRDLQGNERVVSGLMEYYRITAHDPGEGSADGNPKPPGRAGA